MKRPIWMVTLALAFLVSSQASAQVKVRDHRKPKPKPSISLTSFAPVSGVPGTRIEIRGSGFHKGDRVDLGGTPLPIHHQDARRIIVVVPEGAQTDYITITRPDGEAVRSARTFQVLQPAPRIGAVSPESGPAGTRVRITGTHLTNAQVVTYGRVSLTIAAAGHDFVEVVIPVNAKRDEHLTVRTASGEARSPNPFRLEHPPVIARVNPTWGRVGDRIEIYGSHFRAGDRIEVGGRDLRIEQLRDGQITALIPHGARSGVIELRRGKERIAAPGTFEVVYAPAITGFSPIGGEAGTRVTVKGLHLTADTTLLYGNKPVRILGRTGDTELTFEVPRRAQSEHLTVRTRGGEARSAAPFEIHVYPDLAAITPRAGIPGIRITLRGKNLQFTEAVHLGTIVLPIERKSDREIVVQLPAGSRDDAFTLVSYGRSIVTRHAFKVLPGPEISGINAASGYAGDQLVVRGRHFSKATDIYFGGAQARILRRKLPGELIVEVPAVARGTHSLYLREGEVQIQTPHQFTLLVPPQVTAVSPAQGKPGDEVRVSGTDLGNATEILLGGVPATVLRRVRNGDLIIQIPTVRPGTYDVLAREAGGTSQTGPRLQVLPNVEVRDHRKRKR